MVLTPPIAGQQFTGIQLLIPHRLFSLRRQVKLRHKARVFASALDLEWLGERLKEAAREQDCHLGKKTPYGQRCLLDFGLRRRQKAARLRSVWNVRPGEDFPQLVTCYVL